MTFRKGEKVEINALGGWVPAQFVGIDAKGVVWVIYEGRRCCTSIHSIRRSK